MCEIGSSDMIWCGDLFFKLNLYFPVHLLMLYDLVGAITFALK
jgi:hypothetical protein